MIALKDLIKDHQLITVSSGSTIFDAIKFMSYHNIGLVPIVDGDNILGVFSERDLLVKVVAENIDPTITVVDLVMSKPIISCESKETYITALEKMKASKIRHIIVTENGKPISIVSMRDLLELDIVEKGETLEMLNNYITR